MIYRAYKLDVPEYMELKVEETEENVLELRMKDKRTGRGIIRPYYIIDGSIDFYDAAKIDIIVRRMVEETKHA